ncbi:hypothetical protein GGR55DRAFT_647828 [Xylaria sp. FL0064]|nr:hypothetical protein GGR55DRAFT_647828 [Xylaria sp. FL0064]
MEMSRFKLILSGKANMPAFSCPLLLLHSASAFESAIASTYLLWDQPTATCGCGGYHGNDYRNAWPRTACFYCVLLGSASDSRVRCPFFYTWEIEHFVSNRFLGTADSLQMWRWQCLGTHLMHGKAASETKWAAQVHKIKTVGTSATSLGLCIDLVDG